jgi:peptide deformylase
MSEDNILVINTDEFAKLPEKEVKLEPLPLYGDTLPMLSDVMPHYDIKQLPNPTMTRLIKQLKMTMKQFGGIGLSANQCNIRTRMFIIGTEDKQLVCINPKVIKESAEVEKNGEGCLSFPGLYLKIERPLSIDVEFTDEMGKVHNETLTDLVARCFLHELDHMNGVKFTSHVGPVSLKMAEQKRQKLIKKIQRRKK